MSDIEIITHSKDINYIKNMILEKYPELLPYSNSCSIEREFGENEECGFNIMTFKTSPNKEKLFIIVYCKEAS